MRSHTDLVGKQLAALNRHQWEDGAGSQGESEPCLSFLVSQCSEGHQELPLTGSRSRVSGEPGGPPPSWRLAGTEHMEVSQGSEAPEWV